MFIIMPILIMLIIVGVLIMLYRMIILSNRRFITSNRVYLMLAGYFVLLLVSVGIFMVTPYPESNVLSEEVDKGDTPAIYGIYFDVVEEGVPIDQFKDYQKNKWEFEFSGEQLNLQFRDNETYDLPIIIERKGVGDTSLEAAIYSAPSYIEGIDLSSMMRPTGVNLLKGNVLEVNEPHNIINVVNFKKEFIFDQFSDEDSEDMFSFPHMDIGENLLYLRIPNGVQVSAHDYLEIEYLD